MSRSPWRRVSRARPCSVCDKPDWCLVVGPESGPEAAICARVESANRRGEAGWLHRLREGGRPPRRRVVRLALPGDDRLTDFSRLADEYRQYADADRLAGLARALGLCPETLGRFGAGWSPCRRSWSFPMRDGKGGIIGIHLRRPDGRKLCMPGSRLGLFAPGDLGRPPWFCVAEGLTDAAALAEMRLPAVGRPVPPGTGTSSI